MHYKQPELQNHRFTILQDDKTPNYHHDERHLWLACGWEVLASALIAQTYSHIIMCSGEAVTS